MLRAGLLVGSIVLTAVLLGAVARAEDTVPEAPDPVSAGAQPVPWLLGDWGGARIRLRNQGVDFQFGDTKR